MEGWVKVMTLTCCGTWSLCKNHSQTWTGLWLWCHSTSLITHIQFPPVTKNQWMWMPFILSIICSRLFITFLFSTNTNEHPLLSFWTMTQVLCLSLFAFHRTHHTSSLFLSVWLFLISVTHQPTSTHSMQNLVAFLSLWHHVCEWWVRWNGIKAKAQLMFVDGLCTNFKCHNMPTSSPSLSLPSTHFLSYTPMTVLHGQEMCRCGSLTLDNCSRPLSNQCSHPFFFNLLSLITKHPALRP